ncbi:hypothetical protein AOQ84DRAFT_129065 [Glonium stellatum]|uniref:Uncharacterized protein n=1 Tax=Glonium stellatum TaxID=574774 RepID=A0A8E2JP89_9PEZI|nr:hypothetical protein AOQ84DRAFT_129065 [Glonium stellatum]
MDPKTGPRPREIEIACANMAVKWLSFNEEKHDQPNEAARVLHYRSRLAYLTGEAISATEQRWDTEIRTMAGQLQEAIHESAEYIFSGSMNLVGDWKDAKAFIWSTTCQLCEPSIKTRKKALPIHFLMCRNTGR